MKITMLEILKSCSIIKKKVISVKKFAIIYNKFIKNSYNVSLNTSKLLKDRGVYAELISSDGLKNENFDFIFVVGGDGTFLKIAKFYSKFNLPVFGINLGRLGFLSQAKESELELAIEKIIKKEINIEERLMLKSGKFLALNDFVVKGAITSRTSKFRLSVNETFVCDYIADGIIISTPTGSTAYGLSAGGPVLSPKLNSIVIVPICPHTLTARPLVIPGDEKISISTCCDNTTFSITADGEDVGEFSASIDISKAETTAKLALIKSEEFYSVLRNKLNWGVSPKN